MESATLHILVKTIIESFYKFCFFILYSIVATPLYSQMVKTVFISRISLNLVSVIHIDSVDLNTRVIENKRILNSFFGRVWQNLRAMVEENIWPYLGKEWSDDNNWNSKSNSK